MSSEVAIRVEGVDKTFKLPHDKSTSIKGAVLNFYKKNKTFETQKVLSDISFEVKKGEFFGVVGRNGSGKSTLLKLMAGIYSPNQGVIHINGVLTPFIELGVGFNPELTGRENVYLNGALLGFTRSEINSMYDEIVDFAELERFMDQKLKNYSSGMQVRLAFSIAIKTQSEILLIDEVLAVGDAAFQKKCFDYFMKLKKDKRTVILVTHDMAAVRQYCDRAIMINDGEIVKEGGVEQVAQAYQKMFNDEIADTTGTVVDDDLRWGTGKLQANSVVVHSSEEHIEVKVVYGANTELKPPVFGFNIYNSRGMNILEGNTIRKKVSTKPMSKGDIATLTWRLPNMLASDTYSVSVSCCNRDLTEFYDWLNEASTFIVAKEGNTAGFTDPELNLSYEYKSR